VIRAWRVALGLARDDGGPIGEDAVARLLDLLRQDGLEPQLDREGASAIVARMRLDATDDRAARSAAEGALGTRAHQVWSALGLPPFTITFVDTTPVARA
jgi:hypothetical protein